MLSTTIICGLAVSLLLLLAIYVCLYGIIRKGTICKVSKLTEHDNFDDNFQKFSIQEVFSIMGRANPCSQCKTDVTLHWRFYEPEFYNAQHPDEDQIQWIVACSGCGKTSGIGSTQQEAGENWNKENPLVQAK